MNYMTPKGISHGRCHRHFLLDHLSSQRCVASRLVGSGRSKMVPDRTAWEIKVEKGCHSSTTHCEVPWSKIFAGEGGPLTNYYMNYWIFWCLAMVMYEDLFKMLVDSG